jgi:hypothetical protein
MFFTQRFTKKQEFGWPPAGCSSFPRGLSEAGLRRGNSKV